MKVSDRVINYKKITQPPFDANMRFTFWGNHFQDVKNKKNKEKEEKEKRATSNQLTPRAKESAKNIVSGISSMLINPGISKLSQEQDENILHDDKLKTHYIGDQLPDIKGDDLRPKSTRIGL